MAWGGSIKGAGCWPSAPQRELIEAIIGRHPVTETWPRYNTSIDLNTVNSGEARLYPMLAPRLDRQHRADPRFAPLIQSQIRANARYLRNLKEIDRLLADLREHGIETIVTKGFALLASVYKDGSLRPAADIDLLIPPGKVLLFCTLAENRGWKPKHVHPQFNEKILRYRSTGIDFQLSPFLDVEVHAHFRTELLFEPEVTTMVWRDARMVQWEGRSWQIPGSSWLLIETILHGTVWNVVHSMRWIVDGYRILERDDAIDWPLIMDLTRRASLSVIFRNALEYLSELGARVPDNVLEELKARKPSRLERLDYRLRLKPEGFFARYFPREPVNYWLRSKSTGWAKLSGFFTYFFVSQLGISQVRSAPRVVGRKFLSRIASLRQLHNAHSDS